MISPYIFEVSEFKSNVKMRKLTVGSCQLVVKLTEEYKKLKLMILLHVFEVGELKPDDKIT